MNRPKTTKTGLPENVRINNGAYCVRYTEVIDGKRRWRQKKLVRVSDGLPAMHDALAKFYSGDAARSPALPDMPARIHAFCKWYFPQLTPGVQREYVHQYRRIGEAFADFDVAIVQKKDCFDFLEENFKPASRIKQAYRSRLHSFFRWCADRGYRESNPAADIRLKAPAKNTRYPTNDEFHKIRDAMLIGEDGKLTPSGEMMQCFIDLLYLTAQRPTDIRLLRWSQIHDAVIEIKPTKTQKSSGKSVNIPVTDAIAAVLDRAKSLGTVKGMFVIHQRNGSPYAKTGIGSAWKRACQRAHVDGVTTRHMRPKATTDALEQGSSLEALQTMLAHTTRSTTEGYVREHTVPTSIVRMDLPKREKSK